MSGLERKGQKRAGPLSAVALIGFANVSRMWAIEDSRTADPERQVLNPATASQ
jgi:hypothetical protein